MKRGLANRLIWMVLLSFATALLVPVSRVLAEDKKPATRAFFWKVTSGDRTIHLLGSMHVAGKDMYPLPKEIEDTFANSTVLVEEVDMSKLDPAKMLELVKQKGMYTNGDTLTKKISDETFNALKKYCEENQIPVNAFDTFKPWMASMTIQVVAIQKMGLDPNLGIDKHFLDEAKDKKKVEEMETADFQLNLISGLPEDLQQKMLLSSLLEAKSLQDGIQTMRDAWMAGATVKMQELITKSFKDKPELAVVEKKLISDRNVGMMEKIEGYLKGKEQVFVVVGAASLIGDNGILKLLSDKGYKVEQMEVTPAAHAVP